MNKKEVKHLSLFFYTLVAFAIVMMAGCFSLLFLGHRILAIVFAAFTLILSVWSWLVIRKKGNILNEFHRLLINRSTHPNSDFYNQFSLPVLIIKGNEVVWYNGLFRSHVLKGEDIVGFVPEEILSQSTISSIDMSGKGEMTVKNKHYQVYATKYQEQDKEYQVLYYADITDLRNISKEFVATRPVVAILSVDSFDEITANMPESDQGAFKGAIDREIEAFTSEISGITKKLRNNRYISVFDERSLSHLKSGGFSVLDKVRALELPNNVKATLSIGVGRGEASIKQCEAVALQALEMAQGRGGDQTAIRSGNNYEFFGGVTSQGVEKRTKVKTRVVASALKELIRGSDRVFIMGHQFGDIDSLGASYGLWKCAQWLERESYIVLDEQKHLAKGLIQKIREESGEDILLSGEQAKELVTRKSLLIVCDTHRKEFLDDKSLLDLFRTVVVVDHHRKNTDFIDHSVIFYHEPSASSTCEMVAELLQYIDSKMVSRSQADALLAGIMLDTRNFVLKTGVRTFEASAFLRGKGADPVRVKKLFSDSIDVYRQRAMLVSKAVFMDSFAIALPDACTNVSRVAASQAADELLNIEDVDASFVLYPSENSVNISARSLGRVNVQLIMEALGGGGHHTMAAAQICNVTLDEAKQRLIQILQQSTRKDDSK